MIHADGKTNGRRPVAAMLEPVKSFLRNETTGGALLLAATMAALVWANSPASSLYFGLWETKVSAGPGSWAVSADLRHWVNEGLMVLFFFVIGLEVKRELVNGELRQLRTAVLPVVGAIGGVLLPVAVFMVIAGSRPTMAGWGIPIATDIAFAVGILALFGDRIGSGTKLFLLSLAIVDDVIAVAVIALFYTSQVHQIWLAAAVLTLAGAVLMRRVGVWHIWPYALIGLAGWYATYRSGVHPTVIGVAFALLTPANAVRGRQVLLQLEHRLHPITALLVVPVFALANAGVALGRQALTGAGQSRLAWGVALGLLVGKAVGITLATRLAVRFKLGELSEGMTHRQLWGVAALAGIGFTMSLFIADLAFAEPALTDLAKIGILAGSLTSAALGVVLLRSRVGAAAGST